MKDEGMHHIVRLIRGVVYLTLALLLAFASYLAVRDGLAYDQSQEGTLSSVRHAVELSPGSAEYLEQLAALLENEKTGAGVPTLKEAVRINPWNAPVWTRLGFAAETAGKEREAESYLLRAARSDRTFDPRWSLANYYCRKGDERQFWRWAAEAADSGKCMCVERTCDARARALLILCDGTDREQTYRKLVLARPQLQPHYLSFLLSEGRLNEAQRVADLLVRRPPAQAKRTMLDYCEEQLRRIGTSEAIRIWNSLVEARIIGYTHLSPATGASLTNATFADDFLYPDPCFDWRPREQPGLVLHRTPRGLEISLSGSQAEETTIITQLVPVVPGADYRLKVNYRTDDIPDVSGLNWRVFDEASQAELGGSANVARHGPHEMVLDFQAPANCALARLRLDYRRPLGDVRIKGLLALVRVGLDFRGHEHPVPPAR